MKLFQKKSVIYVSLSGLLIVGIVLKYGISLESSGYTIAYTLRYSLLVPMLMYASYMDLKYRKIPNCCVAIIGVMSLMRLGDGTDIIALLPGAAAVALIFSAIFIIEGVQGKKLIGRGDAKLLFVLGLHYEIVEILYIVLISCIITIGYFILALRDKRQGIALCPMIAIGVLIITFVR